LLVKIVAVDLADFSLDQFDQDKGLDDGISSGTDLQASMIGLVQNSESVAEVVFDLPFGGYHNFIFCSFGLAIFSYSWRPRFLFFLFGFGGGFTYLGSLGLGGSSSFSFFRKNGFGRGRN